MSAAPKLKIFALAVIYVLHITFFDVLMSHGFANPASFSLSKLSHLTNHHSRRSSGDPDEYSYRLLTKHELSKQIETSIPVDRKIVSQVLCVTDQRLCRTISFSVRPCLKAGSSKLYCIFRSLLL